ncbi:MAG: 2-oxoglutarate dehydrogenase complex dihydrolipoyllysine-residue succinyltransferase [Planctomycetaceae bacterium]|nr:2-oxoglutarate dehydrogenase complex dihydrolipoyllysine-residue succinyltransferase [Planctomycetaceae bacterium]
MATDVTVPSVGESITEVQIGEWFVSEGDYVSVDDVLVEVESEKASFEIPAPAAGVVQRISIPEGTVANVGDVIASIDETAKKPAGGGKKSARDSKQKQPAAGSATPAPAPAATAGQSSDGERVMPAAARLLEEHGLKASAVQASGPGGRLLKEDVQRHLDSAGQGSAGKPAAGSRTEEVVPMSFIRKRIATRLVEAQQNAALLTTFNEIDLSQVMSLRKQYRDAFEKEHGVKLGFMSFFVKAVVDALQLYPALNAEVRGNDIVYHQYCDIGIAVGGGKGLVVPVLRNAEFLSFSEIEKSINDFGRRAQTNDLKPDELQGGTFTISNGGVYGSLMSTPIVNPPQSGVLGMHAIQERPVAVNGEVVIRPMMYVALTYDHRVVDGREAVTFLKRIRETVEDPSRILLEV